MEICQRAGLDTRLGFEGGQGMFIRSAGARPCAYIAYTRSAKPRAGFDDVAVYFGGASPEESRERVRGMLERSLEVSSVTEVGGEWPSITVVARAKKRVYFVYGGAIQPAPTPTPTPDYIYFEAQEANSTVSMVSTLTTAPSLEYSTDGHTWQEWQHTTANGVHTFDTLTLTAVGDKVYFRGDNHEGLGTMPEGAEMPLFSHFDMTGKIAAGGNIMSLLDKDMEMTEVPVFGLALLFGNVADKNPNTSLTSAAAMPAVTNIGASGCSGMYAGCTSLTSAAAMPAVTTIGEGGCASMYYGCTSLTSAAAMPAVTNIGVNGCAYMYAGCTFNMSNDGTTLNFDFPTPPITAGETTYPTAYDVAQWMGNTNGFTNH